VSNDDGRQVPDDQRLAPEDPGGLGPQTRKQSWIERYDAAQKAEGILAPILTAFLAFFAGGIVVLITTGKNPLKTYQAIFDGSGLNYLLPWISSEDRFLAELNLQQTLLLTTPLILTGLAVAFAFRCGMFNIGGQGQYLVGSIFAVWIGTSFAEMNSFLHILLAIVVATLAGALWAGIAGFLKATVGAHEVISTIMLNWIAIWVGQFLFGLGGPLQNDTQKSVPISNDIVEAAKLHVFWGDPLLQGLSVGIFVALAALVVYWVILNRTTLGFSVRAVGFSPEAARYGGISVSRNYFLAMAISGCFAGLAGALDILGWQFRLSTSDIQTSAIGFTGIAVALLGRNTAVGVGLSALLFGALINGTSTRNLDPEVFQPELASNLTLLIQGLVVLFVGADVIVLTILHKLRRRGRPSSPGVGKEPEPA
jgi:general nucleoside transport system permease protein